MKFSVLLPTRNRLFYLKYAVASVLQQDYEDWEIIISDNHSQDNVSGYVESLNDSRIKYHRTESFVSVTENWNNTMNQCKGDYVIMLGDDDILLKDYFSTMVRLLDKFNNPNVIYANAYIYSYPGVIPTFPDGHLMTCKYYPVFNNETEPFWLSKEMARHLVEGHLNFRAYFGTNMQFILIKKQSIEQVRVNNQFFHSPYPDVYAMCKLMLEIDNILIYPKESVVIGVTPKSTGNFLVNNNEEQGMEFLNISKEYASHKELSTVILPGSHSLTCWLISMETLKSLSEKKHELNVNYKRYRLLQIEIAINSFFHQRNSSSRNLRDTFKRISLKEKFAFFFPVLILHFMKRFCPQIIKKYLVKSYLKRFALSSVEGDGTIRASFSNIFEIFKLHVNGKLFFKQQVENLIDEIQRGKSVAELSKSLEIPEAVLNKWVVDFKKENRTRIADAIQELELHCRKVYEAIQESELH